MLYCRDTGEQMRPLGDYLTPGKMWFEWSGLRVQNWHRPLSTYMKAFLAVGLSLRHFDEPKPSGGPEERVQAYARFPYLNLMEWEK